MGAFPNWFTSNASSSNATHLSILQASFANLSSSYLNLSTPRDFVYQPLRGLAKLDHFIVRKVPDYIFEHSGAFIAAAGETFTGIWRGGYGQMADAAVQVAAGDGGAAAGTGWKAVVVEAFQAGTFRSYFGMIHYMTSRWAFSCFMLALILNRVQIYASTRQRIFLTWEKRLALRLVPIILFATQIHHLLQVIQCQTSPEYSLYRHGDINKYSLLDWAPEGGFLHQMSSTLLGSTGDEAACAAVEMSRASPDVRARYGSFSMLWPTFTRLCLSHLVETVSCHIQQLPPMTEVGMSVFEHSLAFSEAETMISQTLGIGLFGPARTSSRTSNSTSTTQGATIPASGTLLALSDATKALTGPHIMDSINVPVEVLFVALLSCCNALASNIISVFNKQKSLRLLNTGFWALCFMAAFVWGFFSTSIMVRVGNDGTSEDMRTVSGLLHFPTVAIIGFIPHVIIMLGMLVCAMIYMVALGLTALSLDSNAALRRPANFWDRLKIAHDNLQAAVQVRGITFRWHEDFYTALLRIGFALLTAASEAVFLNEGRSVEMRQFTWLEEERLDEIESSRASARVVDKSYFQIAEDYGLPSGGPGSTDAGGTWRSGYANERKTEDKNSKDRKSVIHPHPRSGGVGALQRTTRFYLLFLYIQGITFLIGGYMAFGLGAFLDRIGITTRPAWLRSIVGRSLKNAKLERERTDGQEWKGELDFWFLNGDGTAEAPRTLDTDIEPEMRRRLALVSEEDDLDSLVDHNMYEWWKIYGWYGTKDESGDYTPSHADDFDTTSVVSMSTTASIADEDEWESEPEGQLTPKQHSPAPTFDQSRPRSTTPLDTTLDPATLARLLNPQDRASRDEARMLASHLSATSGTGIMTRSRYRHELETERARVLLVGRQPINRNQPNNPAGTANNQNDNRPLTPVEEAEVLESLILARRRSRHKSSSDSHPPDPTPPPNHHPHPASDNPSSTTTSPSSPPPSDPSTFTTPPCVVCQSAPRTIITWPCRCLCVCEDCRVNLALNNFANCVTCRRQVGGFVRLWVP